MCTAPVFHCMETSVSVQYKYSKKIGSYLYTIFPAIPNSINMVNYSYSS